MSTKIIVTSRGRANNQITIKQFPESLLAYTSFLVPESEVPLYKTVYPDIEVIGRPASIANLEEARQFALENIECDILILADDDLTFHRRDAETGKYAKPDLNEMISLFESWIHEGFTLVGPALRVFSNVSAPFLDNKTVYNFVMLDRKTLLSHGIRYGRIPVASDCDILLQIWEHGLRTRRSTIFITSEKMYTAGGCSYYRTTELELECDRRLLAMHPPGLLRVNLRGKPPRLLYGQKAYAYSKLHPACHKDHE